MWREGLTRTGVRGWVGAMAVLTLGGDLRTELDDGGGGGGGGAVGSLGGVEVAVDAFCGGFDAGVVTASDAAEVVARVAVLTRRLEAVAAQAARRVDASGVWKHRGLSQRGAVAGHDER